MRIGFIGARQRGFGTHMRSHHDNDFRLPAEVRPLIHWPTDTNYSAANITYIGNREIGTGKLDLNCVNEGPIYQFQNWAALKNNRPFVAQINTLEAEYDIYDRKSAEKPRVK